MQKKGPTLEYYVIPYFLGVICNVCLEYCVICSQTFFHLFVIGFLSSTATHKDYEFPWSIMSTFTHVVICVCNVFFDTLNYINTAVFNCIYMFLMIFCDTCLLEGLGALKKMVSIFEEVNLCRLQGHTYLKQQYWFQRVRYVLLRPIIYNFLWESTFR